MKHSWSDTEIEKFCKAKLIALDEEDEADPDFWLDLIYSDLKDNWVCQDIIIALKTDIGEGLKTQDLFEKYLVAYVK